MAAQNRRELSSLKGAAESTEARLQAELLKLRSQLEEKDAVVEANKKELRRLEREKREETEKVQRLALQNAKKDFQQKAEPDAAETVLPPK